MTFVFGGRRADHIAQRFLLDGDVDEIVFFCGHTRRLTSEARDRLIEFGGVPVCLQCDGAPKPAETVVVDAEARRRIEMLEAWVPRLGERQGVRPRAAGLRGEAMKLYHVVLDVERFPGVLSTETRWVVAETPIIAELLASRGGTVRSVKEVETPVIWQTPGVYTLGGR